MHEDRALPMCQPLVWSPATATGFSPINLQTSAWCIHKDRPLPMCRRLYALLQENLVHTEIVVTVCMCGRVCMHVCVCTRVACVCVCVCVCV